MRIKTGIEGFDELIEGGLIEGRQYLVSGSPGAGKTTFGIQFLATGALNGEPGAYVVLSETVDTIIEDMSRYSFHLPELVKNKKVFFSDLGPSHYGEIDEAMLITPEQEAEPQEIAAPAAYPVFKKIETLVKLYHIKRLVLDSLSAIRFTSKVPANEEKDIGRFVRNLKNLDCTTILLSELTKPDAYTIEQFSSHGVIFLHNYMDAEAGGMVRAIQILKMRGTKHDCNMRFIEFTNNGLKVSGLVKK